MNQVDNKISELNQSEVDKILQKRLPKTLIDAPAQQ